MARPALPTPILTPAPRPGDPRRPSPARCRFSDPGPARLCQALAADGGRLEASTIGRILAALGRSWADLDG